jgi:hypothetical protein
MYGDLPLGINLIEDSSFESGISLWSTSHTWLPGTYDLQWKVFHWSPAQGGGIISMRGKHVMYMNGASSQSTGMGGAWYDLGVLPEGDYIASASFWIDNVGVTFDIKFRAGRANDIAAPAIIGSTTHFDQWETINGIFHSDGINPSMLLIRNEENTNYATFAVDQVAVISAESAFQMDLYQQMTPVADKDAANAYSLKRFLRAYSMMFEQIEGYVRDAADGTPGWGTFANPMTAPAETLDWLAQISGTVIPFGMSTSDKRNLIRDAPGRSRGTRDAIVRAVQKYLTGNKMVIFRERTTDFSHFGVAVLKSEAPASDWFTNIVTNPSFESGTSGWATTGGSLVSGAVLTIAPFPAPASGTESGKVVTTSTGQGIIYSFGVLAAGTYAWRVSVRADVGPVVNLTFDIGGTSTNAGIIESWQSFGGTFTADGVSTVNLQIKTASPTTAATFYVDEVMGGLAPSIPSDYFEGSATNIIKNAVESERPVELIQDNPLFLDTAWTYFSLSSTLIVTEVSPGVPLYSPILGSYQDVVNHFNTYTDLKNDTYH